MVTMTPTRWAIWDWILILSASSTVKLGYYKLGYNKQIFLSQIHVLYKNYPGYNELPVITNKFCQPQALRYNRVSLYL